MRVEDLGFLDELEADDLVEHGLYLLSVEDKHGLYEMGAYRGESVLLLSATIGPSGISSYAFDELGWRDEESTPVEEGAIFVRRVRF